MNKRIPIFEVGIEEIILYIYIYKTNKNIFSYILYKLKNIKVLN